MNKHYALILLLLLSGCKSHFPHMAGNRQVTNGESKPEISAVIYTSKGDGFIENLLSEEEIEVEIFVPAAYSTDLNYFHIDDLNTFIFVLKEELLEKELVGSVSDNYDENALVLVINFITTSHDSHNKKYEAFVEFRMAFKGNKRTQVYNVSSSYVDKEVDSEDFFAREKRRLLERVISFMLDDISKFLESTDQS